MSLMNEYIARRLDADALQRELMQLIEKYNTLRGTYLFVYVAAFGSSVPDIIL